MAKQPNASGNMYLSAAQVILAEAGQPMHPSEITERGIATGLIKTTGKTPAASMAAQLYTNINLYGEQSPFVKTGKARFGLRVWSTPAASVTAGHTSAAKAPTEQAIPSESTQLAVQPPTPTPVVTLARDPAERIVGEILKTQLESADALSFERALAEAFAFLGFTSRHVGGPGQ